MYARDICRPKTVHNSIFFTNSAVGLDECQRQHLARTVTSISSCVFQVLASVAAFLRIADCAQNCAQLLWQKDKISGIIARSTHVTFDKRREPT